MKAINAKHKKRSQGIMTELLRQTAFNFLSPDAASVSVETRKSTQSGTFTGNMSLPVHRWFRYSAGFSAEWAESVIAQHRFTKNDLVFDPFAGSGTTLLAAQANRIRSAGVEHHKFVHRIAKCLFQKEVSGFSGL